MAESNPLDELTSAIVKLEESIQALITAQAPAKSPSPIPTVGGSESPFPSPLANQATEQRPQPGHRDADSQSTPTIANRPTPLPQPPNPPSSGFASVIQKMIDKMNEKGTTRPPTEHQSNWQWGQSTPTNSSTSNPVPNREHPPEKPGGSIFDAIKKLYPAPDSDRKDKPPSGTTHGGHKTPRAPKTSRQKRTRRGQAAQRLAGRKTGKITGALNNLAGGRYGAAAKAAGGSGALGALGKFAGPVGMVIAAVDGLSKFKQELEANTERLQAHNRELGQYSAQMATVMAQREVAEINRTREKGDLEAESAKYLTNKEQYRKDNTKDWDVLTDKIENYVTGYLNEALGSVMAPLNMIAKGINALVGASDQNNSLTLGEWLQGIDLEADKKDSDERSRRERKDGRR